MLEPTNCTICGSLKYKVLYPARLPPEENIDFTARRPGRSYHPQIVECLNCHLVYSNPFFSDSLIKELYTSADYIDEPQLQNMTEDYVNILKQWTAQFAKENVRILEIGCATGFFLSKLYEEGYRNLSGIEPGAKAVSLAPDHIKPFIEQGFFSRGSFSDRAFDVVCCFQVLDHLSDPLDFMRTVKSVLTNGGLFITVNHNIRSALTRLLGERSPMYDIEHIYLFDKHSIRHLLAKANFEILACRNIANGYTLDYALKMLPLPSNIKKLGHSLGAASGMTKLSLRLPGGNMLTVAQKKI